MKIGKYVLKEVRFIILKHGFFKEKDVCGFVPTSSMIYLTNDVLLHPFATSCRCLVQVLAYPS